MTQVVYAGDITPFSSPTPKGKEGKGPIRKVKGQIRKVKGVLYQTRETSRDLLAPSSLPSETFSPRIILSPTMIIF